MTGILTGTERQPECAPPDAIDAAHGWYFYGITTAGSLDAVLTAADVEPSIDHGVAPLQLVEYSAVAAVVRPVLLDDFTAESLSPRLQNSADLESMVRRHNDVVEGLHRRQAILPSKFGVVYARMDEIVSALGARHDELVRQLHRLQDCDEWAVHLYADEGVVRERVSETQPTVRRLRDQIAVARPGRAYFLEQQLRAELRAATQQELAAGAQTTFDRLSRLAVDCLTSPVRSSAELAPEVEILRASFLVSRRAEGQFESEVLVASGNAAGFRCELTGPWPPYCFAAQDHEVGHE